MVAEQRTKAYLKEAELTLDCAEAIFERAKRTGKPLWSKVIKEAYDAMENCAMAALAYRRIRVPRYHMQRSRLSYLNLDLKIAKLLTY